MKTKIFRGFPVDYREQPLPVEKLVYAVTVRCYDNAKLTALLNDGEAAIHPFIIGELACGNLKNRKEILSLLHALPHITKADDDEVLFFIEKHKLMGLGIGLIDLHLLASCKLSKAKLLTQDKRLKEAAIRLRLFA